MPSLAEVLSGVDPAQLLGNQNPTQDQADPNGALLSMPSAGFGSMGAAAGLPPSVQQYMMTNPSYPEGQAIPGATRPAVNDAWSQEMIARDPNQMEDIRRALSGAQIPLLSQRYPQLFSKDI